MKLFKFRVTYILCACREQKHRTKCSRQVTKFTFWSDTFVSK